MKKILAILFLFIFATSCFAFAENTDNFKLADVGYRPYGELGEIEYFGKITNNSGKDYASIEFEICVEFQGNANFDKFSLKISSFTSGAIESFNQQSPNLRLYDKDNSHELKYTIKSAYSYDL